MSDGRRWGHRRGSLELFGFMSPGRHPLAARAGRAADPEGRIRFTECCLLAVARGDVLLLLPHMEGRRALDHTSDIAGFP